MKQEKLIEYQKWYDFYRKNGFSAACSDELAYLKACDLFEI